MIQNPGKPFMTMNFKNLDKNENKTKTRSFVLFNKNIENKYKLAVDGSFQVI